MVPWFKGREKIVHLCYLTEDPEIARIVDTGFVITREESLGDMMPVHRDNHSRFTGISFFTVRSTFLAALRVR